MTPTYFARWESKAAGRFYEVRLQHDLFGELEIQQVWGGLQSRRGGFLRRPLVDVNAWPEAFLAVERKRTLRGYTMTQIH